MSMMDSSSDYNTEVAELKQDSDDVEQEFSEKPLKHVEFPLPALNASVWAFFQLAGLGRAVIVTPAYCGSRKTRGFWINLSSLH
jgi:hypothetical protein